MSKAEDERLSLEKKKIEELNGEILEKFVSVQNNRNSNRKKSEEWRIFNENFIKENAYYLKKLILKIDANNLLKKPISNLEILIFITSLLRAANLNRTCCFDMRIL